MFNKIWFKFPERVSVKTLVLRTPCFDSSYPQVVRVPRLRTTVLRSVVVHVGSSTDFGHYAAYVAEDKAVVEYNDEFVSLISIAEGIKKRSRGGCLFFYSNQKLSGNVMQKSNEHQNKDKGKTTSTSINADDRRKLKTVKRRKRIPPEQSRGGVLGLKPPLS